MKENTEVDKKKTYININNILTERKQVEFEKVQCFQFDEFNVII